MMTTDALTRTDYGTSPVALDLTDVVRSIHALIRADPAMPRSLRSGLIAYAGLLLDRRARAGSTAAGPDALRASGGTEPLAHEVRALAEHDPERCCELLYSLRDALSLTPRGLSPGPYARAAAVMAVALSDAILSYAREVDATVELGREAARA